VFAFNGFNPTENLVDASNEVTTVSYRSIDTGGFFTSYFQSDLPDGNDLQDEGFGVSGTNGIVLFELRNLIPEEAYDIAIYLSESLTRTTATRLDIEHQGGTVTGLQTSSPTFSLPGLVNQDYLSFNNLQPLDLGDGSWGFQHTITYDGPTGVPAAGIVSGLQVEGRFLNAGIPGDHNGDGSVDAADYVVWRKNDGTHEKYDTWRANFGQTASSGGVSNATVPEPVSAWLLIFGAAVGTWRGRRISLRVPSSR